MQFTWKKIHIEITSMHRTFHNVFICISITCTVAYFYVKCTKWNTTTDWPLQCSISNVIGITMSCILGIFNHLLGILLYWYDINEQKQQLWHDIWETWEVNSFGRIWWPLKRPKVYVCWEINLSPLATDTAGKLDVLGHDGDTFGVDGTQVGVLKQTNEVSLRSLLQGHDSWALEAEISLEVLGNLSYEPLEGQFADEELSALLVSSDLTESHCSWPVSVGLLYTSGGWGALTGSLGSQLFSWGLASSWFTGSLLGTSHLLYSKVTSKWWPGPSEVRLSTSSADGVTSHDLMGAAILDISRVLHPIHEFYTQTCFFAIFSSQLLINFSNFFLHISWENTCEVFLTWFWRTPHQ